MLLFFFISGTFVATFNPVSASELAENSWNTKMPMSQARQGLGAVTVDGKIYASSSLVLFNRFCCCSYGNFNGMFCYHCTMFIPEKKKGTRALKMGIHPTETVFQRIFSA